MMETIDYRYVLANAEAYKTTRQTRVYLPAGSVFPWHLVTDVEPGGSHRLDIETSVRFGAKDPTTGIEFTWYVDIEPSEANGLGHYEIDVVGCREVIERLQGEAKAKFQEYLATCAEKVAETGRKWQSRADSQMRDARFLHSLASLHAT